MGLNAVVLGILAVCVHERAAHRPCQDLTSVPSRGLVAQGRRGSRRRVIWSSAQVDSVAWRLDLHHHLQQWGFATQCLLAAGAHVNAIS